MRKIFAMVALLLLVLSSSLVSTMEVYAPHQLPDESSGDPLEGPQRHSQVEGRDLVQVSSFGDVFEVNLTIIDPSGDPATWADVYIYKGFPTRDDWYVEYEYTEDTGNVTLHLGRGSHVAIIIRGYTKPKFLAIYRFYVRGNETFTVQVADLTFPAHLEAVKPLANRPFTGSASFVVKVLTHPNLWDFWFSDDYIGFLRVFLPRNLKYSFAYRDSGSLYALFVKNMKVSKVNTTVRFDASKTGFLKPVYVPPTSNMIIDYLELEITGKDLPEIYFSKSDGEFNVSTSTGSYESYVWIRHNQEEGDYLYSHWFSFATGRVSVSSKKVSQIQFGGDLKGYLKPSKSAFKPGDTVELDYRFEDAFKHRLSYASVDVYNKTDDEWEWIDGYYRPKYLNIYDSEGLLESYDYTWSSTYGTAYLYTQTFIEPGAYTVEFVIDPGLYQGEVTSSAKINIK